MSKNDLAPGSKAQLIQRILGRKTGQAASDGRMAEQSAQKERAEANLGHERADPLLAEHAHGLVERRPERAPLPPRYDDRR